MCFIYSQFGKGSYKMLSCLAVSYSLSVAQTSFNNLKGIVRNWAKCFVDCVTRSD